MPYVGAVLMLGEWVDFHWEVDGEEYEFKLEGGTGISLRDLFTALGICSDDPGTEEDEVREFLDSIGEASFSNPDLAWVGKVQYDNTIADIKEFYEFTCEYSKGLTKEEIENLDSRMVYAGEWGFISKAPFTSEETLAVNMKNGEEFTIKVTDAQISTHVITADGKDYIITVTYGDDAEIPYGAVLEAKEIVSDSEEYAEYLVKALKAIRGEKALEDVDEDKEAYVENTQTENEKEPSEDDLSIEFARFFDIQIIVDGEKIEPAAPVKVTITYADALALDDEKDLLAVHFGDNGTEVLDVSSDDEERKSVVFIQDSFSVTGTIVTSGNSWPDSNGKYLMYVEYEGNYYAIAHDGSLTPITVQNNKVTTDFSSDVIDADYLWTYERQQGMPGRYNYFVFYNNGSDAIYLDPREETGFNDHIETYQMPNLSRSGVGKIAYNPGYTSPSQYIGININNNKIVGLQSQDNANPIQFATIPRTVTIHFVDRKGTPLTGVSYKGNGNYPVTPNVDGTYSIPYDWENLSGSVSLENDFTKDGYTYASSHLAGVRQEVVDGETKNVAYTYDGLTIDAKLTEKNRSLHYYSDNNINSNPKPKNYAALNEFNIDNALSVPEAAIDENTRVGTTNYSSSYVDKDIYVIMDPVLNNNSSGGGSGDIDVTDPAFEKKLVSNGDGTYTLSLSVNGSGQNIGENPKANVLLIVDTSSSMDKNDTGTGNSRLNDTKLALKQLASDLLAINTQPGKESDTMQLAMISFDGDVVDEYDWGSDLTAFNTKVDGLAMHRGTDWEDALSRAYEMGVARQAEEPDQQVFVVFFTDGEPSNYRSFHGAGEFYPNAPWGYEEKGYRYWFSYFLSRESAKDEARAIVNSGMTLYSIFAYNSQGSSYAATGENGGALLHNMTKYAYNTPSTSSLSGKRYFLAQNTSQLNDAFASILNSINEYVGVTDVKVNDNITSLTSVGITNNNGNYTGFKYTRTGGRYGTGEQAWEGAPSATYDSTGVHWDLSSLGVLEPGVTYKVSFTVWPSQDAYDWVADLNNGIRNWDQLEQTGLQDHFIRVEDSSKPSGYRYEVATNPRSLDDEGHVINNKITYTKTHRETVGHLPEGVTEGQTVTETDPITGTKTKTTYTLDPGGHSYTKTVVTEAVNAFGPPNLNMGLDDTAMKVQKRWVVSRPTELVAFLYNTFNGELIDNHKNIDFVINQGSKDAPYAKSEYKTVRLGFKRYENVDGQEIPVFDWADETQPVEVKGKTYNVGTIWEEPLDIAVGLMLTPEMALEREIDLSDEKYIPIYAKDDTAHETILYYVLEKGHDYSIDEPTLDYRFDFSSEEYHPMLVDSVLRDAKIKYQSAGGREIGILESITPPTERLSALRGDNVLRGELMLKKKVIDSDGNDVSEAVKSTEFPFHITLYNEDGKFYNIEGNTDEHNTPWYGVQVNGEGETLYYHKLNEDGTFSHFCDEHEACIEGSYNEDLKPYYHGNMMTESTDHKTAEVDLYVSPTDIWTITNIPEGTTYTITETPVAGYTFVRAEEIGNSENKVQAPSNPVITGTITVNDITEVDFFNSINPTALQVEKVWTDEQEIDHSQDYIEYEIKRIPYHMVKNTQTGQEERVNFDPEVVAKLNPETHQPELIRETIEGFTGILSAGNEPEEWTETVTNLPKAGKHNNTVVSYEYYVTEGEMHLAAPPAGQEPIRYKSMPDGGEITAEGDHQGEYSYVITNEPMASTDQETEIYVEKEWKNADGTKDTSLHKDDSIKFNVIQKKYEAKVKLGENDYRMLYPITFNLTDKRGTNQNPRRIITQVVYVPSGASFVFTPTESETATGAGHGEHNVEVTVHGTDIPVQKINSEEAYTINSVNSALEITFKMVAGHDLWFGEGIDNTGDDINTHEDELYHQWTYALNSNEHIIWNLDEMLYYVLEAGEDGPANTNPSLVPDNPTNPKERNPKTLEYTMTLNNAGTGTEISNGVNAQGQGVGSQNETWKGSIKNLIVYEYKEDKTNPEQAPTTYVYTYEVEEASVRTGADEEPETVDTTHHNDPDDSEDPWNGETSLYLVKWAKVLDEATQTYVWTMTNQKKPPIDISIYKVDKDNIPDSSTIPDSSSRLKGASFKLVKKKLVQMNDNGNPCLGWVTDSSWGTNGESAEVSESSQNPGVFSFKNLAAGFYEIVETQYPTGYIQGTENPVFEVKYNKGSIEPEIVLVYASGSNIGQPITGNATELVKIGQVMTTQHGETVNWTTNGGYDGTVSADITVGNTPGAALPHTGGPGTNLFYLIGLLMMAFAGIGFVMKRRKIDNLY